MYKNFTKQRKWRFLMRVSFAYLFLLIGGIQLLSASNSRGQGLEDIMVTIEVNEGNLESLLKRIEHQTPLTFAYLPSEVQKYNQITLKPGRQTVKFALDQALEHTALSYRSIENSVVIFPKQSSKKSTNNIETRDLNGSIGLFDQDRNRVKRAEKAVDALASFKPIELYNKRLVLNITGRVTDVAGEPLIGVNILVKGTNKGTTTDLNGEFSLEDVEDQAILVLSYIGYQGQEVAVGGKTNLTIIMQEDVQTLDEVVVVGYGSMKKSDLTGSVAQVNAESFQNQSMTQITDMLTGTAPGVYTNQSTSAAGGGSIEIRGPSSLAAGTSPLIVLDGAIYNGSISDINPNDVESMDILKDASSAAVFGAKAASGVILITTKKGVIGKPIIDFSSKVGIGTTTNDLKPFGPKGYLDMHRDYLTEIAGSTLPYGYYFSPDELPDGVSIDQWRNFSNNPASDNEDEWISRIGLFPIEIANYKAGNTTDFYDLVINSGLRQDYTLGVGGGSEDFKYYLSLGYLKNEGIIKGDEFSTIRTRLNLDLDVTNWLHIGAYTQFASRDQSVVPANLWYLSQQSPYGSMWNEDGTIRRRPNDYSFNNPLENYYGQERLHRINTLFSSLFAEIKLPYDIHYKISFQPNLGFSKDYNFWSSNTTTGSGSYVGGFGRRKDAFSYQWLLDQLLTWNKEIGIHKFDVTLLANAEVSKSWSSQQENSNFAPNENLIFNALQFGSNPGLSNNDSWSSGDALMARLNYTLLDKYLVTASVRRDGYSAFGQLSPQAIFPAFALAWKISEESFYNIAWMDQLKLRLSWGENGNRDIGAYTALARLGSVLGYDGSNVETGVYSSTLANPGLRWERTRSANIGIDIGLFQNRININIDAYDATTRDLLLNRQLPIITGFQNITTNLGELGNKGLEILLNSINIDNKSFEWESAFSFSMNRNKIKSLWGDTGEYTLLGEENTGELPDFTNKWFPGRAKDIVWEYDVTEVWQLDEKEAAFGYGLAPGDYKAKDVNDDGKYTQFNDKKFIGYTAPRYRIGFRNEFTLLENWDVSIFIRADLGHIRSMPFLTENKSVLGRTNYWSLPYWSRENPTNDYQRYVYPDNLGAYGGGLTIYKPTGFVRVQDLSLSYRFTPNTIQWANLTNLRVFASARNVLTFTDWPGFDPESNMTPMPKVFTVGLSLAL